MPGQPGTETRVATEVVTIRVTPAQKAAIAARAAAAGETVSEYCRRAALSARIVSAVDQSAIADLNRLGGLFKWQLSTGPGGPPHPLDAKYDTEVRTLLRELGDAIEILGR